MPDFKRSGWLSWTVRWPVQGGRKFNDGCLERHFHKDTAEEMVNYHCDVLEAKIVFGGNLIVGIASEFIENNGEDTENQKKMVTVQIAMSA